MIPVIINVMDVNDNVLVFSRSLYKARINENASAGTPVITVHAVIWMKELTEKLHTPLLTTTVIKTFMHSQLIPKRAKL